jgi:hypothetical protein
VRAEASDRTLLHGDQHFVLAGQTMQKGRIERLCEASIRHRRGYSLTRKPFGRFQALVKTRAQ